MIEFIEESADDLAAQRAIRSRANSSMAILEAAFIRNGSGRYVVLRPDDYEAFDWATTIYPDEEKVRSVNRSK